MLAAYNFIFFKTPNFQLPSFHLQRLNIDLLDYTRICSAILFQRLQKCFKEFGIPLNDLPSHSTSLDTSSKGSDEDVKEDLLQFFISCTSSHLPTSSLPSLSFSIFTNHPPLTKTKSPDEMKIRILYYPGGRMRLRVKQDELISSVLEKSCLKIGKSGGEMEMFVGERVIWEERKIRELDIEEGSILVMKQNLISEILEECCEGKVDLNRIDEDVGRLNVVRLAGVMKGLVGKLKTSIERSKTNPMTRLGLLCLVSSVLSRAAVMRANYNLLLQTMKNSGIGDVVKQLVDYAMNVERESIAHDPRKKASVVIVYSLLMESKAIEEKVLFFVVDHLLKAISYKWEKKSRPALWIKAAIALKVLTLNSGFIFYLTVFFFLIFFQFIFCFIQLIVRN
jgi:hypothetical protein